MTRINSNALVNITPHLIGCQKFATVYSRIFCQKSIIILRKQGKSAFIISYYIIWGLLYHCSGKTVPYLGKHSASITWRSLRQLKIQKQTASHSGTKNWKNQTETNYRNVFYLCGFYQCVNSGESLTNWVKHSGLYVRFARDSPKLTHE